MLRAQPSARCCGPPPGATSAGSQCAFFALPKPVLLIMDRAALDGVNVQPNRDGSTQVLGKRLNSSSASAVLVATMLCCFVQALIKCFPCKIVLPLTDFLDCLSPAQSTSARACNALGWACHPNRHPTRGLPTRNRPTLFMFFKSCVGPRHL